MILKRSNVDVVIKIPYYNLAHTKINYYHETTSIKNLIYFFKFADLTSCPNGGWVSTSK